MNSSNASNFLQGTTFGHQTRVRRELCNEDKQTPVRKTTTSTSYETRMTWRVLILERPSFLCPSKKFLWRGLLSQRHNNSILPKFSHFLIFWPNYYIRSQDWFVLISIFAMILNCSTNQHAFIAQLCTSTSPLIRSNLFTSLFPPITSPWLFLSSQVIQLNIKLFNSRFT